jgi:GntR family transcriptional regulator
LLEGQGRQRGRAHARHRARGAGHHPAAAAAFSGKPVVVDEIYLPGEIFQGLTMEVLQGAHGSLYSLFESRFGVRMIRAEERIRAVAADRMTSETLGVAEGTPLLSVERVTYTYGDRPVEWRRGLYSTAEHYYLNELN